MTRKLPDQMPLELIAQSLDGAQGMLHSFEDLRPYLFLYARRRHAALRGGPLIDVAFAKGNETLGSTDQRVLAKIAELLVRRAIQREVAGDEPSSEETNDLT